MAEDFEYLRVAHQEQEQEGHKQAQEKLVHLIFPSNVFSRSSATQQSQLLG